MSTPQELNRLRQQRYRDRRNAEDQTAFRAMHAAQNTESRNRLREQETPEAMKARKADAARRSRELRARRKAAKAAAAAGLDPEVSITSFII